MTDSGEGLVDAEARLQELMEERANSRRRGASAVAGVNPGVLRQRESWRLARAELQRQLDATAHPVRREQIALAIQELDRRLNGA